MGLYIWLCVACAYDGSELSGSPTNKTMTNRQCYFFIIFDDIQFDTNNIYKQQQVKEQYITQYV